ncbi:hypothetical protein UA08_01739 [Talaromyces atroroseus]|uniref:dual-specificity kinase n=1 Tax=Talaromyces atroroseus TaxID=1441469 RepID=A0A1Q5QBK0_TALAT|nr:hypothetical protein UA08_01739 [Talaromyces atroroseus]OKL63322.1 hypothetical protein UA08_01739 [Talaromyces atroroseus]
MAFSVNGNARARTTSSRASDSSRNDDAGLGDYCEYHANVDPKPKDPIDPEKRDRSASSSDRKEKTVNSGTEYARPRTGPGNIHSGHSSIDLTNDSMRNASISSTNSRTSSGNPNPSNLSKNHNNKASTDSIDFLAPINFDDFHNSILDEPSLNNFPLPGHGGAGYDNRKILPRPNQWATPETSTTRTTRSNSFRRQSDVTRFPSQTSSINTSMLPPPAPSSRARRQSHVPPPSSASISTRAPRKSVGPGTLTLNTSGTSMIKRRPSLSMRKPSVDSTNPELRYRLRKASNNDLEIADDVKSVTASRSLKAKSLQPPPRDYLAQDNFLMPTAGDRSSSTNGLLTPMKSAAGDANTPSSASKRMSTMPHATGLGARTISPTDARRMKRMSMMPPAPPVPITPPTSQTLPTETLTLRPRSSQSPSMIPRKSVTPSSSRTTPDPSRKSYSSGISLSSNTSYNSARNSSGSLQPRLSQTFSSSRLPTPKPRMESLNNGNEEEVPPVPAIPKAYESPKTESELMFPTNLRKTSLPLDIDSTRGSVSSRLSATAQENFAPPVPWTMGSKTPDMKGKQAALGRKSLQPLKLPPLNLLPLSTPMAAKIDALKDSSAALNQPHPSTPPPRTNVPKTPSTPMTASKASFFTNDEDEGDRVQLPRSNTSHFLVSTSNSSGYRAPSSSSAVVPLEMPSVNRNISPYISSSLPKSNSDFNFMRQKLSGEYSNPQLSAKLMGPRPQTQSSAFSSNTEAGSRLSSTPDADRSSVASKSKLPSTLRHSVSKPILSSDTKVSAAKYDSMPPPRLPASATWNALSSVAPRTNSPNSKSSYLSNRRKSSLSSLNGKQLGVSNEQNNTFTLPSPVAAEPGDTDATSSHRSASSILSPVHKIIHSAKSNVGVKSRSTDSSVDSAEAAADEEMRKLGSKRKDFEIAAKELDELRRRASAKERVSPAQALKMATLNIFERGEIIDFKDIYFCGTQKAKKHVGDLKSSSANFGYDDDRGDYQIVIGDHLAYRYEVVDVLGKGSFGQVVRCVDHKTGQLVAVKIIRNKKRFHQQALVEVNILQKLKEWDPDRKYSVVKFTQSFYFRGHLCISTELLGMNLYEFIKAHSFKGFSLKLVLIHCDLKPENVLIAHPLRSEIKVIDFGSSCFENEKVYTYIQSRFYRSPEVILGMSYGMAIDMWSLGCILAELFTGYPIFPGENEQEQLACIMEVFGPPEKHLIDKSTRRKLFFDSLGKPRLTVSSKGRRRRPSSKDLRQVLKCDDEAFLDFVSRCLRWDPARRMNPNDALNHEFITGIKPTTRPRAYLSSSNLSSKRLTTNGVLPAARPLPEPPSKTGLTANKTTSSSPVKPSSRRISSVNSLQAATNKRISNSGALNNNTTSSSLPRRNPGGNLAAAAAATSLAGK